MRISRRATTVVATFFLAAATGHVMQSGVDYAARLHGKPLIDDTALPVDAAALADAVITPLKAETGLSALPDLPATVAPALASGALLATRMTLVSSRDQAVVAENGLDLDPFGLACPAPTLSLLAVSGGLIDIALAAPCEADMRVELHQGALILSTRTDSQGALSLQLPAMESPATVQAVFASGARAEASTAVPDLGALRRVAVIWSGAPELHLNAYEYNSPFGGAGHVRAATPRAPDTGLGGYLSLLGDAQGPQPMRAEIYTAPVGLHDTRIEIEAVVTPDSCGREIAAKVLVAGNRTGLPLSFAMPGCEAVGDSVVMTMDPLRPLVVAGR